MVADSPDRLRWIAPFLTLLLPCSLVVQAEEATNRPAVASSAAFKQDFLWSSAQTNRLRIGVYLDCSYVAPGTVDYSGANDRKSDAQTINLALSTEFPLNERWFLPVVLGSENLLLESVEGVPIPDRVNMARFSAGLGYRFAENWTLAAGVGPVLYRFENVEGDDVDWRPIGTFVPASESSTNCPGFSP